MLETPTQEIPTAKWVIIPLTYEKWVHPGSKEKHYRAIFLNSRKERRFSKTKFKTATAALAFAAKFNIHLCGKRRVDAGRNNI